MSSKIATAAAVAAIGMGATATAASAYSFDPPSTHFTGTNAGAGSHSLTINGATWTCNSVSLTGDTAASGATVKFLPTYSFCTISVLGTSFVPIIVMHADWSITLTGGTGPWNASFSLLAPSSGSTMQLGLPALDCDVYLGPQSGLSNVAVSNTSPTGVQLDFEVANIAYTQNGNCPFDLAGTAEYQGTVDVPGITATN